MSDAMREGADQPAHSRKTEDFLCYSTSIYSTVSSSSGSGPRIALIRPRACAGIFWPSLPPICYKDLFILFSHPIEDDCFRLVRTDSENDTDM